MRVERVDSEQWTRALPAEGAEVFHTPEALAVLDEHAPGELVRLAGFKGDRPAALLPAFVEERPVGRTVMSPPPSMNVPRLGPLVMPASPKRRKREKLNSEFVESAVERLRADAPGTLFRVVCPTGYTDPRSFEWAGMSVAPRFTYTIETEGTDPEELLSGVSRSLRREIRDAREADVTITTEGTEGARQVHRATEARYHEQGRSYPLEWAYVRDLTRELAAVDRCRVYVARAGGEFLTGVTVLYSDDAAYFWQGGTRTTHDGVSVNSLLHWRVIEDIVTDPPRESVTRYDLMGANTERLCRYKGKFGGRLVPYYAVETGGPAMELAKRAYQLMRR